MLAVATGRLTRLCALPRCRLAPAVTKPAISATPAATAVASADASIAAAESRRWASAPAADHDSAVEVLKTDIINAALEAVPRLGFTREAVRAGVASMGYAPTLEAIFPRGGGDLFDAFARRCNVVLARHLRAEIDSDAPPERRLAAAIRIRLEPHARFSSDVMAAALAQQVAVPENVAPAARELALMADEIARGVAWPLHVPGADGHGKPGSTDARTHARSVAEWSQRRMAVAGVYALSQTYMLADPSAHHADTWAFVDRWSAKAVASTETSQAWLDVLGPTLGSWWHSLHVPIANAPPAAVETSARPAASVEL
ncbi:ubiquinone biosynthesis protein COQ9 [Thecamonas trahens ATCC 50062]|uniref:Ubiquinone biosynthesis protein n=1 Tax=Thecamonas trahens ATCC 50062 TaxID=461836 RepID=A0A0L0D584_THETB|nr:ubiquinone biosynthesis protein COQ9 [Thecamonas trahens ATCC 50062]KNC47537.1 ubiquinone biosynthesis protein COQ9 [Thecamonas trahens ATCC 50062]|eukprot:XP_013759469.1 ubiquinone biosynthesis protein COQ9 [Thecamonas trahens ATCC 50062]